MTSAPSAANFSADKRPMLPVPTTPTVDPLISLPIKPSMVHLSSFNTLSAGGIFFARDRAIAVANSATALLP